MAAKDKEKSKKGKGSAGKKGGKPEKGAKPDERKPKKGEKPSKPKERRKKASKEKRGKKKLAEVADRHALYQRAVQTPQTDVAFFGRVFEEARGRRPLSLREDFCGTAYLSSAWVESAADRTAIGIDIDPDPLEWGRRHNLAKLAADTAERVTLECADVLDGVGAPTDVVCAMNFSYGVFKTRAELERYFRVVYDKLVTEGMFFTELYGGTEAIVELEEERDCDGFTYVWEQAAYNPIRHETRCHIHFEFPDGSRLERAFSYDWRLWTIPEIRESLEAVGFTGVTVYWETVDDEGEGTGEFAPTEDEENQESWLVYIVARK